MADQGKREITVDEAAAIIKEFRKLKARASRNREALRGVSDPDAMRDLFKMMSEGDPFGVRSDILLSLESMPAENFFETFLDILPALYRRSIDWPFAIILRTINTRGAEDDVSARFEREIQKRGDKAKRIISKVLHEGAQ